MNLSDLKLLPQWIPWNDELRHGKHAKVPKHARLNKNGSTIDPSTWGTATEAWSNKKRYNFTGIGYVFTIDAGVIGIDLDHCFEGEGRGFNDLYPWAQDVVGACWSYTEYSPSGDGVHVFVRGTIPHSLQNDKMYPGAFEMYNEARYFTVTGKRLELTPPEINENQKVLDALFVTFGGDFNDPKPLPDVKKSNPEVSEKKVAEWLSVLPVWGDYNTFYLNVLMAVHSEFPDERGVRLLATHWPDYEQEIRRKFRSFDRTAKDGVKIGTLVHMAKDNGWQPPTRTRKPKRMTHSEKLQMLANS